MSDQNPSNQQPYTPPPPPSFDAPAAPSAPPPPPAGSWDPSVGAVTPAGSSASSAPSIFTATWMMEGAAPPAGWQPKQKMLMGILAILLGGLGIHSFMMGNTKKGIIQICSNLLCVGGLWGLIDGIMIFMGNAGTDAYGVPLTE